MSGRRQNISYSINCIFYVSFDLVQGNWVWKNLTSRASVCEPQTENFDC